MPHPIEGDLKSRLTKQVGPALPNGVIDFDTILQRYFVVFANGEVFWISDILLEWSKQRDTSTETYVSPFTGKPV